MKRGVLIGLGTVLLLLSAGGLALWSKVERQQQFDEAVAALKLDHGSLAVRKFEPLAKSGDRLAQNLLGYIYALGQGGVKRDDELAIHWFRAAGPLLREADKGEDLAADDELWVAYAYANGEQGAVTSPADSLNWLQRSARGGNRQAAGLLGQVEKGRDISALLKR